MEIELKFLIQPDLVAKFTSALNASSFTVKNHSIKQLVNGYFDTDLQTLRNFDMGLRIRSTEFADGNIEAEQTVKLAGKDIGGLHQRPEFNVALNTPACMNVDLSLFDNEIWPTGFVEKDVQPHLQLLFKTEFTRTEWLIEMPSGSEIECVLDQGEITSNGREAIISEIELELKSGMVTDLFLLAQFISSKVNVRLGFLSKAARGYQLLANKRIKCMDLNHIDLPNNVSCEEALTRTLSEALKFVQHNEQVFCSSMSPKALRKVIDGWSMIIHTLQLFSAQLFSQKNAGNNYEHSQFNHFIDQFKTVRKQHKWADSFYQLNQLVSRKSPYKKDIENNEHLSHLMTQQQLSEQKLMKAVGFFSTSEYNQLIINFVQWLSQKQWRTEMSLEALYLLNEPLSSVSNLWLESAWQNLQINLADYKQNPEQESIVSLYWPLVESLLTGLVIGSLYSENWQQMRNSQLDLLLGCEEFLLLTRIEKLLLNDEGVSAATGSAEDVNKQYLEWVRGKQKSLNFALSASVNNVSQLKSFW